MKKWKLCSGLLAIFVSGVIVGYSLGDIHARKNIEHIFSGDRSKPHEIIVDKLARELKLSGEQRTFVEGVVCRTRAQLSELRRHHHPEAERMISSGVAEIRERLDPEQQKKLDALYERMKKRLGKWKRHAAEDCK
ncbi:MAG: hypothetical protein LLG06_04865 [Desulfobacteraceae bacterium]|nr:hypothetical protein [Desulfobacteraceae bacterium]